MQNTFEAYVFYVVPRYIGILSAFSVHTFEINEALTIDNRYH